MLNGRNAINFFKIRWVTDLNSSINERSWISKFICIEMSFSFISHDDKNEITIISWFDDFSPQCMIFKAKNQTFQYINY